MAKVSIIIPIYNVENYVKKTIESAINQTEKDIEIILVDDGSMDSSGSICDEYAKVDHRIVVLHKTNGGLSSARNAGTELAKSKFLMYLDGDDFLSLRAVERLLAVMKKYPSDFIQFRYKEVDENHEDDEKEYCSNIYQARSSKELFENLYKLGGVAASGATKFVRKELMLKVPFISIQHEDEMWCTQAFKENLTVTYIEDELYYYVTRSNSIIHSTFNQKKLDIFQVMDARIGALAELGLDDLLSNTYRKIFITILELYREADVVKEDIARKEIKGRFIKYMDQIDKYAFLEVKFRVLFKMMKKNFGFVKIYEIYRNRRWYKMHKGKWRKKI